MVTGVSAVDWGVVAGRTWSQDETSLLGLLSYALDGDWQGVGVIPSPSLSRTLSEALSASEVAVLAMGWDKFRAEQTYRTLVEKGAVRE